MNKPCLLGLYSALVYGLSLSAMDDCQLMRSERQKYQFHQGLELMQYSETYDMGKSRIESCAWGVHYNDNNEIHKTPYWPAVYALGAFAAVEHNYAKACTCIDAWMSAEHDPVYAETQEGKTVARRIDELCARIEHVDDATVLPLKIKRLLRNDSSDARWDAFKLALKHYELPEMYQDSVMAALMNVSAHDAPAYLLNGLGSALYASRVRDYSEKEKLFAQAIKAFESERARRLISEIPEMGKSITEIVGECYARLSYVMQVLHGVTNQQALQYRVKACKHGNLDAILLDAMERIEHKGEVDAIIELEAYADSLPIAMYLGTYYTGQVRLGRTHSSTIDLDKAELYIKPLVDAGNSDGILIMGLIHKLRGNNKEAFDFFKWAETEGNSQGLMQNFKLVYETGHYKEALGLACRMNSDQKKDVVLRYVICNLKNYEQALEPMDVLVEQALAVIQSWPNAKVIQNKDTITFFESVLQCADHEQNLERVAQIISHVTHVLRSKGMGVHIAT